MNWDEVREALYADYETGLPNKRAYEESVKGPTQMNLVCTSLQNNLDLFRHNRRDLVLPALARAVHEEDPDNVYYYEGARFKVQAEDIEGAHALAERVNRRFAKCTFTFETTTGLHIACMGLGFSYGLGINEDDALDAFCGRVPVTRRRRYVHRLPDCIGEIEALYKYQYPLVEFHIPPQLKAR